MNASGISARKRALIFARIAGICSSAPLRSLNDLNGMNTAPVFGWLPPNEVLTQ